MGFKSEILIITISKTKRQKTKHQASGIAKLTLHCKATAKFNSATNEMLKSKKSFTSSHENSVNNKNKILFSLWFASRITTDVGSKTVTQNLTQEKASDHANFSYSNYFATGLLISGL